MKVVPIILLFLLGSFVFTFGQNEPKFADIVKEMDAAWEGKNKGKGSGYKQYQRWKFEQLHHLDAEGRMTNSTSLNFEALVDEQEKFSGAELRSGVSGSWFSLGPQNIVFGAGWIPGNGRVNVIAEDPNDPNTVYIGAPAGGIWRGDLTDPKNPTWVPLSDGIGAIGVSGIAIDPRDSDHIFILTGDGDNWHQNSIGVLVTFDGGNSWRSTGLSFGYSQGVTAYKLMMDPNDPQILFACTTIGLFRSTNGGVNWTNTTNAGLLMNQWITDLEFQPGNSQNMVLGTMFGIIARSDDNGQSWNITFNDPPVINPPFRNRVALAVTPDDNANVYAIFGEPTGAGTFSGVWLSTDTAASFTQQTNTPNILSFDPFGGDNLNQGAYDLVITVDPTDEQEVLIGGVNLWGSSDQGGVWNILTHWDRRVPSLSWVYTHGDWHALEYFGGNARLYGGNDGGVYLSRDQGTTWLDVTGDLQLTQPYRMDVDNDNTSRIIMGTQDNGTIVIEGTVARNPMGADGGYCWFDESNDNVVYSMIQNTNGVWKSTDGGFNFTPITASDGGVTATNAGFVTPIAIDPSNSQRLIGGYGEIWETTDGAATWSRLTNGTFAGASQCRHVEIAPSNSDFIATIFFNDDGDTASLWVRPGASEAWVMRNPPISNRNAGIMTDIAFNPANELEFWVTVGGYLSGEKVFYTDDGGVTWENVSESIPNIPCWSVTFDPVPDEEFYNPIYVGTDIGVYYRNEVLDEFVWFNFGLPNVPVRDLEIGPLGTLVGATFGRGIWTSTLYDLEDRQINICWPDLTFGPATERLKRRYTAHNEIISERIIEDVANIRYEAGSGISLLPGFHAKEECFFDAKIQDCTPFAQAKQQEVQATSGTFAGPMPGLSVEATGSSSLEGVFEVFPNPTQGLTTLRYEVTQPDEINIYLVDVVGRYVRELQPSQDLDQGTYELLMDMEGLEKGMYHAVLEGAYQKKATKVFLRD